MNAEQYIQKRISVQLEATRIINELLKSHAPNVGDSYAREVEIQGRIVEELRNVLYYIQTGENHPNLGRKDWSPVPVGHPGEKMYPTKASHDVG